MQESFLNIRKLAKTAGHGICCVIAFLALVLGEAYLRTFFAERIPVEIAPGVRATASAGSRPDFLWIGESWHIQVKSDQAVELEVDGRIRIRLPSGNATIYSNHDSSNAADYGIRDLRGPPSRVSVKPPPKPPSH